MKLRDKIKWRLDFLFKKKGKMSFKLFLWNILPARSQIKEKIIFSELKKCSLIKIKEGDGNDLIFDIGSMRLVYPKNLRMSHFAGDFTYLICPQINDRSQGKIGLLDFFPDHEGPYEIDQVQLEKGDWVIDAGANIGMFSIIASKKIGTTGKVFSFEPIMDTQKLLRKNIDLNEIENVEVAPFALGEDAREINFSMFPGSLECSSAFFNYGGRTEKVRQISLDQFVEENKITKIDFIKADIEGMEENLLMGSKITIRKFKPKISLCTYHRPGDAELFEKIIKDLWPGYKTAKDGKKIFAWV